MVTSKSNNAIWISFWIFYKLTNLSSICVATRIKTLSNLFNKSLSSTHQGSPRTLTTIQPSAMWILLRAPSRTTCNTTLLCKMLTLSRKWKSKCITAFQSSIMGNQLVPTSSNSNMKWRQTQNCTLGCMRMQICIIRIKDNFIYVQQKRLLQSNTRIVPIFGLLTKSHSQRAEWTSFSISLFLNFN